MNESAVRQVMAELGIEALHRSDTGWINCRCPLAGWTHERGTDKKPAFAIRINEVGPSHYTCLACKYKGRVAQLVRTLERFSGHRFGDLAFRCDAYDAQGLFGGDFESAGRTNNFYQEPTPIDEAMVAGVYPPVADVPEAAEYLYLRGVGEGTWEELELCFDPDEQRVLFPVRGLEGQLFGYTGRTILEPSEYPNYRNASYEKVRDYLGLPKRSCLLGIHRVKPDDKPIMVVEGLIGYANLVQSSLDLCYPVALLGSTMTQQKADLLALVDRRTYLLVDPDDAGESCLWGTWKAHLQDYDGYGAVHELGKRAVVTFVPEWPEGIDDIDKFRREDIQHIINCCPMYTEQRT